MSVLSYEEIGPKDAHQVVIWLHGLGADASDFMPIVPHLNLQNSTRFIFPNAPIQEVTINQGMQMRSWYDIYDLTNPLQPDLDGMKEQGTLLSQLIDKLDHPRITIGGFSQGGAMALYTAFLRADVVKKAFCLSGYWPDIPLERSIEIPILMAHGVFDNVIPFKVAQQAARTLKTQCSDLTFFEFESDHQVPPQLLPVISNWLRH